MLSESSRGKTQQRDVSGRRKDKVSGPVERNHSKGGQENHRRLTPG
jgi:hypothetical protein